MSTSVHCFVSGGTVHFVPSDSLNLTYNHINVDGDGNEEERDDDGCLGLGANGRIKIGTKNLLYTLNNPSLSDLDSDCNGANGANGSRSRTTSPSPSLNQELLPTIVGSSSSHAVYMPEYSILLEETLSNDYEQIKSLLTKVFINSWVHTGNISVKRLTGGITNMLLSCTYGQTGDTVLMRVYGHGTNLIIDRHREFVLHLVLNSLNLAPEIHARFKNGLVYGFLQGRSLEPKELRNRVLYPLIAQQLGNWHNSVDSERIQYGVEKLREFTNAYKKRRELARSSSSNNVTHKKYKKRKKRFISNIWELIEDWITIVPSTSDLVASFEENMVDNVNEENVREHVVREFEWLKSATSQVKSPLVTSHCDLLSGNIIASDEILAKKDYHGLPQLSDNPIKFIDYEYMLPAPRAFDIANHFAEWQGFDCDRSAIPDPSESNETMVTWVKGYLNNENASREEVTSLINEIAGFYGMPGFYWGIWAMIQSEISNINFNYSSYGKLRLQEYWDWKLEFLKKNTVNV